MMDPSWRKPFGIFLMLALIIAWTAIVVGAAGVIMQLHWALQAIIYAILGIGWILPLGPLLRWMETGKWRE
jgi:Protein of unknown function (DUF2842)